MEKSVFPQPAAPHSNDGRPVGRPELAVYLLDHVNFLCLHVLPRRENWRLTAIEKSLRTLFTLASSLSEMTAY